ncbi:hypothetical protein HI113_45915, partial [Corallococcus exiguus]|uniref:hypothetical protein n=1 Tax=Corallococcus exiguus TaxID=83462 RepID=UPI0017B43956
GSAGEAVKTFAIDGRAILSELDARIEEAKIVIATLNTSHDTLAEQRQAGVHVSEIGFQNTKVQ